MKPSCETQIDEAAWGDRVKTYKIDSEEKKQKLLTIYLDTTRFASATVVEVSRLVLGLLCIASYNLEQGWEIINHLEKPLPETKFNTLRGRPRQNTLL